MCRLSVGFNNSGAEAKDRKKCRLFTATAGGSYGHNYYPGDQLLDVEREKSSSFIDLGEFKLSGCFKYWP